MGCSFTVCFSGTRTSIGYRSCVSVDNELIIIIMLLVYIASYLYVNLWFIGYLYHYVCALGVIFIRK